MSTGQPQEHQDLRWPYAQPDDVWPQDGDQNQPVQHSADSNPDPALGAPHPAQHASPQSAQGPARQSAAQGPAPQSAQGPAQQAWDGGATSHEDGWKSDPNDVPGSEDDEDYEWIRYLGGGRSAQAKPPAAPSRRPARPARGKPERGRRGSRSPEPQDRAPQRPAEAPGDADPGSGPPEYADPAHGPRGYADPGHGQSGVALPGAALPGPATKRVPGSRGDRSGSRSGSIGDPPTAGSEPESRPDPVARAPSRPSRRELKAREQEKREQKDLQQKLLEQERREQQAREQKARELDQSERQQRERDAREQAARDQAERKQDERERKAREQAQRKQRQRKQRQRKPEPRKPEPRKPEPRKPEPRKPEPRKPERSQPPKIAAAKPVQSAPGGRSSRRSRRSLARRILWLTAGLLLVVVAVAVAVAKSVARSGSGTAHVLVTPPRLGIYAKDPALAGAMDAEALRAGIVRRSSGEAKNVVDAVYQDTTGPAAKAGPQILLFIGGNLSGASPNAFITSFTGKLKGAVTTSPGSLGGQAACVPSVQGRLAECAWADNDTFGVIASPTLSEGALAGELRQMRPLVEHAVR